MLPPRFLLRLAPALIAFALFPRPAAADPVQDAADAFRAGAKTGWAARLEAARGHELEPYVEYWALMSRMDDLPSADIAAFLQRNPGTPLADKLRADWVKKLGEAEDWVQIDREAPLIVSQGDPETQCYGLRARLLRHDASALDEALPLWSDPTLPPACLPVMEHLYNSGRLGTEEVWLRLRRLLENRRLSAARATAAFLPAAQAPDAAAMGRAVEAPAPYLHKLRPDFAASRAGREMAMVAVARMARSDAAVAANSFAAIRDKLSAAERSYVWLQIAHQAAMSHLPEAVGWYRQAGDAPMTEDQVAWKARAALRAQDWQEVRKAVEAMPPQLSTQPDWIYWRARALAAAGRAEDAQLLYRAAAPAPNFYGTLATEELGKRLTLPARAAPPTPAEMEEAAKTPAIRRALALFRLDLRTEAVREWNWALRGEDDRFLLAAAELARRKDIYDRAINTAERMQQEQDFVLRYLAPFREQVEVKAGELGLDNAWIYGLMRQESRFVMAARSSAGAQGLMQVMPATARWVARKAGWKDFTVSQMSDLDTNIRLGTQYLRYVLDSLDGHPVLASAAYNAGPGRARRWRDGRPMEGAIYAETIPFTETRDYVKKVMSNATYYAALFGSKPQSLKTRLGTIMPANAAATTDTELP